MTPSASEISPDRVEDATTQLKVGDKVSAVIISVDRKTRNIQLSIKQKEAAEARRTLERVNSEAPSAGTTNLGALLKAKLENH